MQLEGLVKWKGKRSNMCMIKGVWENVRLEPHVQLKNYGLEKGISGWNVVC